VLLIDELSEFLRSKPTPQQLNEDARVLQFLGELTSERPLWIIAAVQESIESTGDIARAIIRKIKDRYPIKLALSTVHIRSLICERWYARSRGPNRPSSRSTKSIARSSPISGARLMSSCSSIRCIRPPSPPHRTGGSVQQHRGIVDFVCSRIAGDDRRRIPSILDRPERRAPGSDSIYEHFSTRLAEFSAYNIYRVILSLISMRRSTASSPKRPTGGSPAGLFAFSFLHRDSSHRDDAERGKLAELVACGLDTLI